MSIELATVVPDTSGKGLGCNPTLSTDKHDEVRKDPERSDKTRKHFEVLSRTTVQTVTNLELETDETKNRIQHSTTSVIERIGGNDLVMEDELGHCVVAIDDWDDPAYDAEFVQEFGRTINDPEIKEADQGFTPDAFDNTYVNMELALPREGGEVQFARVVVKRLRDKDSLPIGTAHDNPILDSRM